MPAAVIVSRLSKHYGHWKALNDVSLTIAQEEIAALIGASGVRKVDPVATHRWPAETSAVLIIVVATVSLIDLTSAGISRRFI